MGEEAPAAQAKAASKVSKKKVAPRPKSDGPTLPKLIVSALADSKDRKGISVSAIKKVLASQGVDIVSANKRVNNALMKLLANGTLIQTKGMGASGSFKLAKREPKAPKPKKVVKKSPAKAKKPAAKKATPKKKATVKKVAAKKATPKKAAAKKAPVKKAAAKKPAAKKSPAKKAAPKKVTAKKPAAKKAPAKKVAAKKTKK
ncbi:histone H1-like [Notolabrus celidotus]|uniref:histone H1-like n=1 Tax=Notolabrus celidotus TaxID=1203425 RepID=UPI00148FA769|nr:histone H1-like [Notolabrus celidotus]